MPAPGPETAKAHHRRRGRCDLIGALASKTRRLDDKPYAIRSREDPDILSSDDETSLTLDSPAVTFGVDDESRTNEARKRTAAPLTPSQLHEQLARPATTATGIDDGADRGFTVPAAESNEV